MSQAGDEQVLLSALKAPLDGPPVDPRDCKQRPALHGFVDFGHVHRPAKRGAGVFHEGAATAWCYLHASQDVSARLRLAWDDRLVLRVNDQKPVDLGHRKNFGLGELDVALKKGRNVLAVTLSNTRNFNHGGWAFAFQARDPGNIVLVPRTD